MSPSIVMGIATLGGIIVGLFVGVIIANRHNKTKLASIGEEVARLRQITESKLGEDDPNLPDLLQELNDVVDKAFRAVDGLEHQSKLMRKKSDGAQEVIQSVKEITSMMEDMGADVPYLPAKRARAIATSLERTEPAPPAKLR